MALEGIFAQLESMGLIVFLIFALIFTVVFAILQKVQIFGDPAKDKKVKNYNTIVAMVMAALVVFPHVLWGTPDPTDAVLSNGLPDIVDIITSALPSVGVVIIAILMALLIVGILGRRVELGGSSLSGWIAMGAFAVIVYIFGASANWWSAPGFMDFILNNQDLLALVLVLLVFAIVIWFITKEDKDDKKGVGQQFAELLQK